ncbi:MAG: hypothetical protein ACLTQI_01190 [Slackia sp.]
MMRYLETRCRKRGEPVVVGRLFYQLKDAGTIMVKTGPSVFLFCRTRKKGLHPAA